MLTVKQVKEQYGISRYTLNKAIDEGKIEAYKPNCRDYLFKETDVETYIESTRVPAKKVQILRPGKRYA